MPRSSAALACTFAALLLLTGCGAADADTTPSPDVSATPDVETVETDEPTEGGGSAGADGVPDAEPGAWTYAEIDGDDGTLQTASIASDDGSVTLWFGSSELAGSTLRIAGADVPECLAGCTAEFTIDGAAQEVRASSTPERPDEISFRGERELFAEVRDADTLEVVVGSGEVEEARAAFSVSGLDPDRIPDFRA